VGCLPSLRHWALLGILPTLAVAQTPKKWDIFLLMGQSNMSGAAPSEAQDRVTNPRVQVLGFDNCTTAPQRTFEKWSISAPSLHDCGTSMGPGDWFSKVMIDTSDKLGLGIDTIGLVPLALFGTDIDYIRKGIHSARWGQSCCEKVPPKINGKYPWMDSISAYPWVIERAKIAMQKGNLRGIIFLQGESDSGDAAWPGKVVEVVADLKKDLGVGDIPFIPGELRYDTATGASNPHNVLVNKLPSLIKNCSVVSAKGLKGQPDPWHFNTVAQRTLGHRYAAAMVPFLKNTAIEPIDPSGLPGLRVESSARGLSIHSDVALDRVSLVSLRGQEMAFGSGREVRILPGRLSPGVYVLRVSAGTASRTTKLLVEH
jgi:hypothetical protein